MDNVGHTRRRTALAVAIALILSLLASGNQQAQAAAPPVRPAIVPTPQEVRYGEGKLVVPDVARVVAGPEVDEATVATVDAALRAAGVGQIRHLTPVDQQGGPFTVTVGEPTRTPLVARRLGELGVAGPDGRTAGGYVLATGYGDGGKQVVLAGVDGDGTFYAAKTLAQLFVTHGDTVAVPVVRIRDWPGMAVRGTIEGFYGTPWSHEQRLRQFDFYGDMKLNVYAYAPKDDPYHRDRWAEPYPPSELERLGELVDRALANHVRFIFAISPGLSICYSSAAHADALIAKFQAVYDLGVRDFNIALDDINYTTWHCPQDPARFGTGAAGAGAAQAYLINQVVTRFAATHEGVGRIQMVPTEYYDTAESPYKRALREQLDPTVVVEWTGVGVVPATITNAQADQARQVFGHDILVWDNYPVNDYAANKLLLGPYTGRQAGLSDRLYGLHANPMNQAEASKIPLVTLADFVWNDRAYDPQRSLSAALDYVAGGDPVLAGALGRFVDVNYDSILNPRNAPRLSPYIDEFWAARDTARVDAVAAALATELDAVRAAPAVIRERLANPIFLDETSRWLDATELWGQAALAALRMLRAQDAGDGATAWAARLEASRAAAAAAAQGRQSGAGVLDTFVARGLALGDAWLGAVRDRPTGTTSMTTYRDYSVARMVDGSLDTFYWSAEAPSTDDFVGVDLGSPREISRVQVAMAKSTSPRDFIQDGALEISSDGSAWQRVDSFTDRPEFTVDLPAGTTARYVRLRALSGQDEWVVVREFSVTRVDGVSRSITGGPPVQAGSSLEYAIDGDPTTAAVASRPPQGGETLTVQYAAARALGGVIVAQNPDAAAAGTVQVHSGGGWVDLGALAGPYTELAFSGADADAIRIVWAGGDVAPAVAEVIGWFAQPPTVELSPDDLAVESGGPGVTVTTSVSSHALASRTATVAIAVPSGWRAEPASATVTVHRGRPTEVPVTVTAPEAGAADGEVTVTVKLDGAIASATVPARRVPPVTNENVALAGAATASSTEQDLDRLAPRWANDGDLTTRWASGYHDDSWLQIQLAQPTRIGQAVLRWETACASAYEIQASADGVTWRTLTPVPVTDCGLDQLRFDSGEAVVYVRMQGVRRATSWGYSLWEFELFPVAT